jgi:predicted neutral ceramidase superfamily lipid hydrolase
MENFMERIESAFWYLLGNPSPRRDGYIVAGLGPLAIVLVLGRMVGASRLENGGPVHVLLVAVAGLVAMIAAVMFLRPLVGSFVEESYLYFAVLSASVVVSMLVVVPLMMLTHRAGSVSSVLSWGVSVAAAMSVVLIARTGIEAASSGSNKAQETKARSMEMQNFLNNQ